MFEYSVDDRLSSWAKFRSTIDINEQTFQKVWEFWKNAPYVPYNNRIDPYFQRNWPSPWEIIVENKYDDFTKALMIGWTIKLIESFGDSKIEVRTLIDNTKNAVYNVVFIDDKIAINYDDNGPVAADQLPDSIFLENLVELKRPR